MKLMNLILITRQSGVIQFNMNGKVFKPEFQNLLAYIESLNTGGMVLNLESQLQ